MNNRLCGARIFVLTSGQIDRFTFLTMALWIDRNIAVSSGPCSSPVRPEVGEIQSSRDLAISSNCHIFVNCGSWEYTETENPKLRSCGPLFEIFTMYNVH